MGVRDHKRAGKPAAAAAGAGPRARPRGVRIGRLGHRSGRHRGRPRLQAGARQGPGRAEGAVQQGGDTIAPGGLDGFQTQLDKVKGYPVVVNNWASWCGPCRTEWPWLQDAAAQHLDEVAFMGVDGDDTDRRGEHLPVDPPDSLPELCRSGQGSRQRRRDDLRRRLPEHALLRRRRRARLRPSGRFIRIRPPSRRTSRSTR